MPHQIKLQRVRAGATWFPGDKTHQAIMEQVPSQIIAECPARLIIAVADATNKAFHAGRKSSGAEICDDAIWCDAVGKLIPLAALRTITIEDKSEPSHIRGCTDFIHRYTMDYTERC